MFVCVCDLKEIMVNVGANHVLIFFQRMWFKKMAERKFCVCVLVREFFFSNPFFLFFLLSSPAVFKVNLTLHSAALCRFIRTFIVLNKLFQYFASVLWHQQILAAFTLSLFIH